MIFFVISGFIMMYVCSDEPPLVFLRRRILRVVPLYWIMTPVYFAALFRDDLAAGGTISKVPAAPPRPPVRTPTVT